MYFVLRKIVYLVSLLLSRWTYFWVSIVSDKNMFRFLHRENNGNIVILPEFLVTEKAFQNWHVSKSQRKDKFHLGYLLHHDCRLNKVTVLDLPRFWLWGWHVGILFVTFFSFVRVNSFHRISNTRKKWIPVITHPLQFGFWIYFSLLKWSF